MNSTAVVAVVILNWNGRKYLEQFLPSVLASSWPGLRVIVADNGSADDSLLFLQERYPQLERIVLEENYGFAEGYNRALEQVTADYYVLLNSDVKVSPGWIPPAIALMESDERIAALQPKILSLQQPDQFEYAGAAGGWIDQYGYPFSRGRVFEVCERDSGQYDDSCDIFWASGAALFIRADLFRQLGGFDPYFFAHQEEIDLCWRLQRAGYRIVACPESVVWHLGGGSLPRGNSRKTYLNYRNNLIMLHKNMSFREKWWKLPYRILLDAVSAWKALLGGDAGYFGAVIRAHFGYLGWLRQKREYFSFGQPPIRKLKGVYRGNLVWAYFLRKRRKFNEIVKNPVL